jgi:hypothetical protein
MISTTTHSHLQYQQQTTLTSNINNNPLSPSISTKAYSHLQYQQQPLSLPISTTTSSHIQYQEQPTLISSINVVNIGVEKRLLLILEVGVGCC